MILPACGLIAGPMSGEKYRRILDENMLESAMNLKLGRIFTFQQNSDPKTQSENHTGVAESE